MSKTAIKVSHLTKIYTLYDKPIDRLKEALHPLKKKYHKEFYALEDVSFEIPKGETVGIIGKNGAGKSTLLKIITGVLTPTSGHVHVNGRIASLLELGAGFNPEYTGIENIYLQGTLMGYQREEMEAKIDAILAFADIGDFVYQPVKIYSSGMFARLAFAVAINVEPDILIVDEVLSVGDMRFQQKSIRKMKEMQSKGVTILFVAHDMGVINTFCSEVIWINKGKIFKQGSVESISKNYIAFMSYGVEKTLKSVESSTENGQEDKAIINDSKLNWVTPQGKESFGEGKAKILAVTMCDLDGNSINKLAYSQNINFYIKFQAFEELYDVGLGLVLKDRLSNNIFTLNSYMYDKAIDIVKKDSIFTVNFLFEFPYLAEGRYSVSVALSEGTQEDHIQHHWVHDIYDIEYLSYEKTNKVAAILAFKDSDIKIINESIL